MEPWTDPSLGPCACSQIRRTSRAISALYDEYLAPASLTVTQYAILVNIARRGSEGISRTALASHLGMDRTTLTRNLRPLEREKLVVPVAGTDRRANLLGVSASGTRRVNKAFPLWSAAQRDFLTRFGSTRLDQLRTLLQQASALSLDIRTSTGSGS